MGKYKSIFFSCFYFIHLFIFKILQKKKATNKKNNQQKTNKQRRKEKNNNNKAIQNIKTQAIK